jgi:predicted amidohydrolase YtcJ
VAIHCVSEVELVFALAVLEDARVIAGDRIEHASVVSPGLADRLAALGLQVCVQPHFIAERGDRYLADVEPRHHGDLYRLRSLARRGIVLAGGSDAPFGVPDPWHAMRAAVTRRTAAGVVIGADEALTPEMSLDLFLRDPLDLTRTRKIAPGTPADLCLLDRPWREARGRLLAGDVRACWVSGRLVHDCVDEAPGERVAGAEALA